MKVKVSHSFCRFSNQASFKKHVPLSYRKKNLGANLICHDFMMKELYIWNRYGNCEKQGSNDRRIFLLRTNDAWDMHDSSTKYSWMHMVLLLRWSENETENLQITRWSNQRRVFFKFFLFFAILELWNDLWTSLCVIDYRSCVETYDYHSRERCFW